MPLLGVNIDHVATVRQARYRQGPGGGLGYGEPDVVHAAFEAQLGGADCITAHLREDRRHVVDRDIELLRQTVSVKFNLEMAGTDEMATLARRLRVHQATLVPEGRAEVTTEGGLDVAANPERWKWLVAGLHEGHVTASAFIDPDERQIDAAKRAGFDACEIHTGRYANHFHKTGGDFHHPDLAKEFAALRSAAKAVADRGMRFNVGHALNYVNVAPVAGLPGVGELHIGHSIVARAVFVGLRQACAEMKALIGATGR
ncbi:MAG: pyridoxine 5'-phosphate synthase [Phycisphaerales bacterium]|nr:pyridoxine 5'-phosphate synthase [Phycisphaerales bacterium]